MRKMLSILCVLLLAGFAMAADNPNSDLAPPVGPVALSDGGSYTPPAIDVINWTTGANMPTARYGAVSGWWNGQVFFVQGRFSNSAPLNTNVCEAYNPTTNTWTTMAPASTKRRMMGAGQVQLGSKIYSVAGRDTASATVNTNESYDMATNTWTTLAPCLMARWACGAAAVNGFVYIWGGNPATTSAEKYDVVTNTWSAIAPLPEALRLCCRRQSERQGVRYRWHDHFTVSRQENTVRV